jgi:ammonium transporter, Amt family
MKRLSHPPIAVALALLAMLLPGLAFAESLGDMLLAYNPIDSEADTETISETAFIFNTFLFLFGGVLVMLMALGFAMLEAGSVTHRSVATIVLKNIALYSIAGLMFFLVGYNLMYEGVDGGYIGSFALWGADDSLAEAGDFSVGYAASSDWFFQMVFVATAASIVSGAVAERIKIWSFLLFALILTGILYPITGAWTWGEGWLDELGFADFAGSTIVHSVGGWAALIGIIILGPRAGRFAEDGTPKPIMPSSVALVALGVFILWFGWFGFNGGSQLALGSGADAVAISNIFANTNIAAASGVLVAMLLSRLIYGRIEVYMTLNGAIGGLVAITAEPLMPSLLEAVFIGGMGGVIVVVGTRFLERTLKLDDVVGAVPAHLFAGIWGTMMVPLTNPDADYLTQLIGVAAIGAFTVLASAIVWIAIKGITGGLRLSPEEEAKGLDVAELGISGYPYFDRRDSMRS